MNSCLPDVDDDRECEWDADDGEEDAEDAARRRHRRDVAVTCDGFRWPKVYIFLWVTWCAISGRVPKRHGFSIWEPISFLEELITVKKSMASITDGSRSFDL